MNESIDIHAPAKINLCLRVGARRPDGYHPIASMMVALDGLGDDITVTRAAGRSLTCPGGPEGHENLAWRAVDLLEAHTGTPLPVAIDIAKRIPMQAGLGGGSSDAAAVLVAVNRLYGLGYGPQVLEEIAAELGSDVPFFIRGGTQWATGRGEILTPVHPPEDLWVAICGPVAPLSTAEVYREFDRANPDHQLDESLPSGRWRSGDWVRNDLTAAAISLAPELADVGEHLMAHGAHQVVLCGSGGAIAGLYTEERTAREAVSTIPSGRAVARSFPPHHIDEDISLTG